MVMRVFVVRHAEKMQGRGLEDVDLSPRGVARARALVLDSGVAQVSAVFVTPYLRAHRTAAPMLEAIGGTAEEYAANDARGVAARALKRRPESSLIVGHCDTVPMIVRELGVTDADVGFVTRYGDLFEVTVDGTRARMTRRMFG